MKNKLYTIVNILIILAAGAFLVYFLFVKEEPDYRRAVEAAVLFVLSIHRLCRGRRRKPSRRDYTRYEEAYKEILEGAFSRDKRSYKKLLKAADCFNRDKYEKAHKILKALEKKCVVSRDFAAVYSFHALCYDGEGRYTQSIASYEKMLQYHPANSLAWSNLGVRYEKAGREKDAHAAYTNAILYDPLDAFAHNNMAVYFIHREDPESALKYALRAVELNANMSEAMDAAATAYKMLGDDENAEKYCKMYGMNGGNVRMLRDRLEVLHDYKMLHEEKNEE